MKYIFDHPSPSPVHVFITKKYWFLFCAEMTYLIQDFALINSSKSLIYPSIIRNNSTSYNGPKN